MFTFSHLRIILVSLFENSEKDEVEVLAELDEKINPEQ